MKLHHRIASHPAAHACGMLLALFGIIAFGELLCTLAGVPA
jgi:hypothetical protein